MTSGATPGKWPISAGRRGFTGLSCWPSVRAAMMGLFEEGTRLYD